MNSATETNLPTEESETVKVTLPLGLLGLPELKEFELSALTWSWPFLKLRSLGALNLEFLLVEPSHVIADYAFVLDDEHAEALELTTSEDVLILNVVTIHSQEPQYSTVNLSGPIIFNRRTLVGRQVVLPRTPHHYSTIHTLVDHRAQAVAA